MKIAINGKFLTQQMTGVQRVAYNFAKELTKSPFDTKVYSPNNIIQKYMAEDLNPFYYKTPKPYNLFWEQGYLHTVLKDNDILLNFANTAPIFNLSKQGVMIHDLAFLIHPEWFSKAFSFYYKILVPIIVKKSLFIMTVSEFSKKELVEVFGINPDKIIVLPLWLNDDFTSQISKPLNQDRENIILSVASLDPRKNYANLLEAFTQLDDTSMSLYAVGGGSHVFSENQSLQSSKSNISFLGRYDDQELISLYNKSMIYCSMSYYEGFGLPLIEAMACGCPLLLSDIPAYRETAGDVAIYANPSDPKEIQEKMKYLINNPQLRLELSQKGRERVLRFQKEKTLQKLFDKLETISNL